MILREKLALLYPAKLRVLLTAVGLLTVSIGIGAWFWRRDGAFVDLPTGTAVALRQDSFDGCVRLSPLAAK